MLQSSITAWLKKQPSTSKPEEPESPDSTPNSKTPADQGTNVSKCFSLPAMPINVELAQLTDELIPGFKRLNSLLLPIAYPASFYTETMTEPHHSITLMAFWHAASPAEVTSVDAEKPRLIGAIRCRILPPDNLYISTIGVLGPYRSHGIAIHLLQRIISKASEEHGVKCVTAHVWEANEDGLEWYAKRGFEIVGREEAYYRKLKPSAAVLVRKWIGVGDLLGGSVGINTSAG